LERKGYGWIEDAAVESASADREARP